ncbi:leucine-rich repeat domain-containing protein [Plastoroseomonas arctica]|uniref:Leucine-rich repeat domain-containing protein n=1 Tax=Plastoroseomonas arctica TaxID=1509237 RepID=A0AAF1JUI0_9PROT|nr:leucine-rich repeat domain-containing protein [Plastoroseomonas arctica]MBR0653734.1 leucine-rich repeat domain-containing protein [Plastoroseomonas arctica]
MAALAALLLSLAALGATVMVFIGIMGAGQTQGAMKPVLYACMAVALAVPFAAFWAWGRVRAGAGYGPVMLVLLLCAAVPGIFAAAGQLVDATAAPAAARPRPSGTDAQAWAAFFAIHPDPEAVDLSHLGLDAIPPEVLRMRRLAELVLTGNRITAIPDTLLDLPELRMVMLRDNPVPAEEFRRFGQVSEAALASGRRARPFAIVQ